MRFYLWNWLGHLCATYRFADGSTVRWTSRESLAVERPTETINVDFYYDGSGGYEYHLPENLSLEKRRELTQMLDEYCRVKGYPVSKGH